MKTSILAAVCVATATAACGESPANYPEPARYETRVEVRPETRIVFSPEASATTHPTMAVAPRAEIVVTTSRKLDRPTEVVGVIDAHEPSGRQDAAFALIRERATAMGADAVLSVEFHHGEEKDEPTHLSGLAVRYVDQRQ